MSKYLEFIPEITERSHIKAFIEADAGIQAREAKLRAAFEAWWQVYTVELSALPQTKAVMPLRIKLLRSFAAALEPIGLLDCFKVAGVAASWWDEVKYELKTLAISGFGGLVDSWVDTIRDALEDKDDEDKNNKNNKFDPLGHKLIVRLMTEYLEEIGRTEASIAELEQQKESFELGDEGESENDEEDSEPKNYVKELESRLKELKGLLKEPQKRIKALTKGKNAIAALQKRGVDTDDLESELSELEGMVMPWEQELAEILRTLEPYEEIKENLKAEKAKLRRLKGELMERLLAKRAELSEDDCEAR